MKQIGYNIVRAGFLALALYCGGAALLLIWQTIRFFA